MANTTSPSGFRYIEPKYVGGGEFWYENGVLMVRCTVFSTALRFIATGPANSGDYITLTPADVDGLPNDAVFAPGTELETPGRCYFCIENNYFICRAMYTTHTPGSPM